MVSLLFLFPLDQPKAPARAAASGPNLLPCALAALPPGYATSRSGYLASSLLFFSATGYSLPASHSPL
ncbi:hypothetical protein EYF80_034825 [Liparis tanakae]|uniref:Uncharacterized protein n=1 Tax=Liparis tanakae TaxID=230148 RepID=A0A4Z2GN27_9TELE|nr:hypothetical protein EYF80_034825 [Liparis tanakae]